MTPSEARALLYDWALWRYPYQIPPEGAWFVWVLLGGRGAGKTRAGAEWVRTRIEAGSRHVALVAKTPKDARNVMLEDRKSGLLHVFPPDQRPAYQPGLGRVVFHTGAIGMVYSGEAPDQLRGPAHDTAWVDEFPHFQYPAKTWDNLLLGLRVGDNPRVMVTTTPRTIPPLLKLLNDPGTAITKGSTFDNAFLRGSQFLREMTRQYEGTRLGRQELHGEVLADTEGALFTLEQFDALRVPVAPPLARIVVAVDPAISSDPDSDETGIVVAGLGEDGHGYVLADVSGRLSPGAWGERVVQTADDWDADRIVAEANQGGEMVEHTVRLAAQALHQRGRRTTPNVLVRLVHATRGKKTRAEPVAALVEQGRVHCVGRFPALEDQCATWAPDDPTSPDRLDAMVWSVTELMVARRAVGLMPTTEDMSAPLPLTDLSRPRTDPDFLQRTVRERGSYFPGD